MAYSLTNKIVIFYCMLLVKCEIFYIKESKQSFCPYSTSCLTLAQFSANPKMYIQQNTSLILTSGRHYLNKVLSVKNVNLFELVALDLDNTTDQSESVHIICNSKAYLQFMLCDCVHIKQVTLIGCGGSRVDSVDRFSLHNSTFVGQKITKSALMINYTGEVVISGSYFLSNRGSSLQTFFIPEHGISHVGLFCGAICAISSNIFIIKTDFIENIQAIFVRHNTNITIHSCNFEENMILPQQIGLASSCIVADSSTNVVVLKSSFINNTVGGVLRIITSTLRLEHSNFSNNDYRNTSGGGSVFSYQGTINLYKSKFTYNNAPYGGVVYSISSTLYVNQSRFYYNAADYYGGVLYIGTSNISITLCVFYFNSAFAVSVLVIDEGNAKINGTIFKRNGFNTTEVGVLAASSASLEIARTWFVANTASYVGVLLLDQCNFISTGVSFYNNTSKYRGILYSEKGILQFHNTQFSFNIGNFSVIYLVETVATLSGLNFSKNFGSLLALRSKLSFLIKNIFRYNKPSKNSHEDLLLRRAEYQGGSVTIFHSSLTFHGRTYFVHNMADNGGALYAVKSTINVYDYLLVGANEAKKNGGGIYLYQSDFQCNDICNISKNSATSEGGAIYASSGSVNVGGIGYVTTSNRLPYRTIHVIDNRAKLGGGLYLTDNAKLYFIESQDLVSGRVFLIRNIANYGGALYVNDNTTSSTCYGLSYSEYSPSTECFFQTLYTGPVQTDYAKHAWSLRFSNNSAKSSGSVLFGGLLDRCSLSPFIKRPKTGYQFDSGLTYLAILSRIIYFRTISSFPVRLCLCFNGQPNCSQQQPTKYVKKGELFRISLVAVDQVNHTVSSTIHCTLSSYKAELGEGQLSQNAYEECTNLNFSVFSPHETETLIMYAEGPCKDAGLSRMSIPISFLPCTCPIGFQQAVKEISNCVCECHYEIQKYALICNYSTRSLIKTQGFWINYINRSDDVSQSGFIYYSFCPYDYCLSVEQPVSVNLEILNGADAQCAFNRSGTLCGACQPALSLSLGSSLCLLCSTRWPVLTIFITIGAVLTGVVLIFLILVLNLTVAIGTLNGLIFYANIIAANKGTYLPFQKPNFCTVLIAWFNLEFEFDTCYFEGMDMYAKTWIHMAFPVYIILLVVIVIFVSERSTNFARLIGKGNPVATLATLILLAFTKFLQAIIAILSFAILEYPDGTKQFLWLPDASIKYLRGKHVPLFLVAVGIVAFGFLYICLLFSWQWLLRAPNKRIFSWVRNTRIQSFMDAHLAPHTHRCRFWTGILLLARVLLYLLSAANVSGDPRIDLLAVSVAITGLIFVKGLVRIKIYKSFLNELLEMMCYINLILFTCASYFSLGMPDRQRKVAYISISFMFAKLLFVLLYHIIYYTRVMKYTQLVYDNIVVQCVPIQKLQNINTHEILLSDTPQNVSVPTTSVVEMKPCDIESDNDNSSRTPAGSITKVKCDVLEKQLNLCEPLLENDNQ